MKPTALLEVENLTVHFPVLRGILRRQVASVHAVDNISFALFPGETLGFVGESGCGKSTVARCLVGLLPPTHGSIRYKGKTFDEMSPEEVQRARREIQIVFQDPSTSLNPRMSIYESLSEPIRVHKLCQGEEEIEKKVVTMLSYVGLDQRVLQKYPHQFSGGQLQRVCIAKALTMDPEVLICDEAVSALDVSVQGQILNLLIDLQNKLGIACLFISHDLAVVKQISHRIVVMYLGNQMEEAPTDVLFESPQHPYTRALLAACPKTHPNEKRSNIPLQGEIPSPLNPPSGCRFRTRCPHAEKRCSEAPPIHRAEEHTFTCILSWRK
ncbi:MAG: ABC transporter ATP-binding protein [Chlamydiia bacterium]|nr:ABC transporter ATP-binding protein [Chlamydiia bacterium]